MMTDDLNDWYDHYSHEISTVLGRSLTITSLQVVLDLPIPQGYLLVEVPKPAGREFVHSIVDTYKIRPVIRPFGEGLEIKVVALIGSDVHETPVLAMCAAWLRLMTEHAPDGEPTIVNEAAPIPPGYGE